MEDGSIRIRPFEERDYPALSALSYAVHGDFGYPAAEMREDDEKREPHILFARFVAEKEDGTVVATADHDQMAGRYHPRRFVLGVDVHPDYRHQGIGSALWVTLETALAPYDPLSLSSWVREEIPEGMHFAAHWGFTEVRRSFPSDLDVAAFDPAPHAGLIDAVTRDQDVRFVTFPELASDLEREQKLYRLTQAIRHDMPSDTPANDEPFETWRRNTLEHSVAILDAYFIAVAPDGACIGYSNLARDEDFPERLWVRHTGVLPEWRGKRIATALKLCGIDYAQKHGFTVIRTSNDSTNTPMLAVNERLGFRRLPAWINVKKVLKEET